jgi:outer membrane protein OmpA-like peptidoglycan-associated protein
MASYVLSPVVTPASMSNVLPRPSGSSLKPVIIIIAALLISAAVFFLFTKKRLGPKAPVVAEAVEKAAPAKPMLTPPLEPPAPPAPTPPPPAPPKPAMTFGFARPLDLGTQVARSLAMGEFGDVAKLGSSDDASEAAAKAVLEKIFKDLGFKVGPEDKVQMLGQIGDATRLSIPLIKPGETESSISLQLDAMRDPKTGWKIAQFRLPKELQSAMASMTVAIDPAAPPSPTGTATMAAARPSSLFVVDNSPDALGTASEFVAALLKQDFAAARKFTDEAKVPAEKLAGLCIVFEEGEYVLKPAKPLVMTVASPTVSWVIAQIQSEKLQEQTEFGVEMQRTAEDKPWTIVGLNLSDLLGSFSKAAGKLGVPYTPIVTNPRGGESLALYFEYDKANLHPRAEKQLGIVASLLKANSARKLRITGHTDAKGADDYNVQLSRARAAEVKAKLGALGVSADQVVTEGMGKAAPLSPNTKADGSDDPEGRSRNRRAEIFLDF